MYGGRITPRAEAFLGDLFHAPDLPAAVGRSSLALGVGRVALEAMMQGVPVIAANHRYLGPIVTPREFAALAATNFVPQRRPSPSRAGLRAAMTEALEDLESRERDAEALQVEVARRFGLGAMVERVESEYSAVVRCPASAASRAPTAPPEEQRAA